MTSRANRPLNQARNLVNSNHKNNVAQVVLGKSMPRSGHHFLVRLLAASLKPKFHYCEVYTNEDCCNSQPCTKQYPGLLFMQKSHDFQLKDTIPESGKFLIQYRHPIPRIFSDWDLAVSVRDSLSDSYESFMNFAQSREKYYVNFYKKWVIPFTTDERFFMMSYEALIGEPFESLQRFLKFAISEDHQLSRKKLEEANMVVKTNVDIQSHKYYKPEFLEKYQMSIIEQLPDLPYLPWKL